MVAHRLATPPALSAVTLVPDIVRCADGGAVVVGSTVFSAWRKPYTPETVQFLIDQIDRAAHNPGPLVSFAVFRFSTMRAPGNAEVRAKTAEALKAYNFHHTISVMDSSGFANAMSRLFVAGVLAMIPRRDKVHVVDSVEAGLQESWKLGVDLSRVRSALDALLPDTYGTR